MLNLINNKVWIYFVKYPTQSIHIREIARRIGISPPSALKQAKELLNLKLLISKKEGKNLIISANYDNDRFLENKKWTNLFLLLDSGILNSMDNETIILFGSFSRGEDTEKSDIDLAISEGQEIKNIEKIENSLDKKIEFHDISHLSNKGLKENIRQGILLRGIMI
jgi:predicted nucleotidyltransferase